MNIKFSSSRGRIESATRILFLGISVKKYIFIGIFIILLLLLFSLMSLTKQSAGVEFNEQGFGSSEIIVNPGTKVTWINNDSSPHWPASDPHPQHNGYPDKGSCIGSAFDACKPLQTGDKFSFTFEHSGTWGVHDHLFPGSFMVVRVRSGNLFSRILSNVRKSIDDTPKPNEFKILNAIEQQAFLKYLAEKDPVYSWEFLKEAYGDSGSVDGAHQYAHMVGSSLFNKLGVRAVSNCDSDFAFGCYHGFAEESIKKLGITEASQMVEACYSLSNQPAGNCIHGLGHAFVNYHQYKLSMALNDCAINVNIKYESACQNGAFMEYSDGVALNEMPTINNFWQMCDSLNRKYDYNCGYYMANIALMRLRMSKAETAAACSKGKHIIAVNRCANAYGAYILLDTDSVVEIEKSCRQNFNNELAKECISESAYSMAFRRLKGWEANSKILCNSLDKKFVNDCIRHRDLAIKL